MEKIFHVNDLMDRYQVILHVSDLIEHAILKSMLFNNSNLFH